VKDISMMEWIGIVQLIMFCVTTVYAWVATRNRASREQIDKLDDRLDDHSSRLTHVEAIQGGLPTAAVVADLKHDIQSLEGSLKAVTAEMNGMRDISKMLHRQVGIMDDYLRKATK